MIESLRNMSEYLEDPTLPPEEQDMYIQKSVRIGLTLMAGYPSTMFFPEEQSFIQNFMKKLQDYTNRYLDNNSDSDFYG